MNTATLALVSVLVQEGIKLTSSIIDILKRSQAGEVITPEEFAQARSASQQATDELLAAELPSEVLQEVEKLTGFRDTGADLAPPIP